MKNATTKTLRTMGILIFLVFTAIGGLGGCGTTLHSDCVASCETLNANCGDIGTNDPGNEVCYASCGETLDAALTKGCSDQAEAWVVCQETAADTGSCVDCGDEIGALNACILGLAR